ncbi:hypothetical protein N7532_001456 [Penicillium argentinense]|uniref:Tim44-like domain-containing protein n=1 Tax=Penicillium argentinense TaxID=1131581 RepID=A0A9W9G2I5_9EURO|nr:uncharacterized protein N7532_001456 [Penicillium argentinense]KAJ5110921.1 hypothetical protein N7532_001456 [Penicillium argentinense]
MASSLRLPAGKTLSTTWPVIFNAQLSTPGAPQCRYFSQASQRWAYKSQNFSPRTSSQPSMKVRSKDLLMGQLPNDIGLLPGTFVRPLWRDMPSIFNEPRDRLMMEWTWIKSAFQNFLSLIIYNKKDNKYPMLLFKPRRKIATDLYKDMYSSFARGDIQNIRKLCCDGLSKKLIQQIENRPSTEKVTWTLENWIRRPSTYFTGVRVLSDRATQLPEVSHSGVRQIVLRLTSRQAMSKTNTAPVRGKAVAEAEPTAKQQDVVEYVVIQNIIWNGRESEWRVWGNTSPTSIHKIYTDPYFAPGLSAMERIQAMMK